MPQPRLVWIECDYDDEEELFESDEAEIGAAMDLPKGAPLTQETQEVDMTNNVCIFVRVWRHAMASIVGMDFNSNLRKIDQESSFRGPLLIQMGIATQEALESIGMLNVNANSMKDVWAFCREKREKEDW